MFVLDSIGNRGDKRAQISKGIKPELAGFRYSWPKERKILTVLQSDNRLFRICPFGGQKDMPLWLKPSMNLLYGLDSVALYSPLVNRDYFTFAQGLGIVDDSIGIIPPVVENLYKELDLLKIMNVKYVISTVELSHPSLVLLIEENKVFLYELKGFFPRFTFLTSLDG